MVHSGLARIANYQFCVGRFYLVYELICFSAAFACWKTVLAPTSAQSFFQLFRKCIILLQMLGYSSLTFWHHLLPLHILSTNISCLLTAIFTNFCAWLICSLYFTIVHLVCIKRRFQALSTGFLIKCFNSVLRSESFTIWRTSA